MLAASAKCRSSKTKPSIASDSASSAALTALNKRARPSLVSGDAAGSPSSGSSHASVAAQRRGERLQGAARAARAAGATARRRRRAVAGTRADDDRPAACARKVADQPALAHAALAGDDGAAAGVPGVVQGAPGGVAADQARRAAARSPAGARPRAATSGRATALIVASSASVSAEGRAPTSSFSSCSQRSNASSAAARSPCR